MVSPLGSLGTRGCLRSRNRFLSAPTASQRQSGGADAWDAWVAGTLSELKNNQLLRSLRAVAPVSRSATRVCMEDMVEGVQREVVVFTANDYLGLSTHAEVRAAASAAALEYGSGPRGSALLCGYTAAHQQLEGELARLKDCEQALLFPTGFAANLSVIGTMVTSSSCAIFSDALNHASIVDGARLASKSSGAELHVSTLARL